MKSQSIHLVDITLKEGGFPIFHRFLALQIENICRGLQQAGIQYSEISHGRGIGALDHGYPGLGNDDDWLKVAGLAAPQLKRIVYISTYDYSSVEKIESLSQLFDIGRVGVNIDEISKAEQKIQTLKKLGKTAIAQLLRVHAREVETARIAARELEAMGADIIYITDNFGSMSAEEVKTYLSEIKTKTKLPLGFQGRNNTGRAIENTLAALDAGAEWLDASLTGMGQGAGLASLEILASLLHERNLCRDIQLSGLSHTSKFFAQPAIRSLPYIGLLDLLSAKHKIDYYPQALLERLADILDMKLEDFLLELKKVKGERVQLREIDLRRYLAEHKLDFDVVAEFLKTGQIPS